MILFSTVEDVLAALLAAAVLEDANLTFVVRTTTQRMLSVLTSVQKVVYLVRHAAMHSGILNSVAKIESTGQVVVVMTPLLMVLMHTVVTRTLRVTQDSSELTTLLVTAGLKQV